MTHTFYYKVAALWIRTQSSWVVNLHVETQNLGLFLAVLANIPYFEISYHIPYLEEPWDIISYLYLPKLLRYISISYLCQYLYTYVGESPLTFVSKLLLEETTEREK